jgi:putative ABC transport system permease protein
VEDVARSAGAIVFGTNAHTFLTDRMVFSSGRMFSSPGEIVVGDGLAPQLHARIGSTITVAHRRMRVVGIYHLGVAYQDTGAFIPLATAQSISGHPGEATSIVVKLDSGTRQAAAKRVIAARFPGLLVIGDSDEALRAGANGQLIANMTLVLAVLALLIGGIGVMNTMLMSVVERRAEFALLSAVGWSGPQVAGLILTEGLIVSLLGAAAGIVIGSVGAQILVRLLGAAAFVSPAVTAWVLGQALLIGIVIGVLGGLYPAWRAAHLSPAQALAEQ